MLNLENADLKGKKVIVRVDINVPMLHGKVTDTERIERIIPTINYLIKNKARVILISHFGRPKGNFNLDMSLAPIVDKIQEYLPKIKVKFAVDCMGKSAKDAVGALEVGEVLILENLRFYKEEEDNDDNFSKELASYGDIYVNDSFSCSHRSHSSIDGITKYLPSYPGLLLREEISTLEKYLAKPKMPMISIVGGSKVSTKITLLKHLAVKSQAIVIGGAMANTFLKAIGIDVKSSLVEDDYIETAKEIIDLAKQQDCEIILPQDVVVSKDIKNCKDVKVVMINEVPDDFMILDIGPNAVDYIASRLKKASTVLWNGPLGAFEFRPFNIGSESIARHVALLTSQGKITSIAGGGDVVASVKGSGLKNTFTYISTAGGAFLDWLQGEDLPGIKALKKSVAKAKTKKSA